MPKRVKTKKRRSTLRLHLAVLRSRQLGKDQEGATAIEYALVASGVGAAVAATVWSVGTSLKTNFYDAIAALF